MGGLSFPFARRASLSSWAPQARRTCFSWAPRHSRSFARPRAAGTPSFRGRPPAGPSLARVPRAPFVPRSSASRSFARARAAGHPWFRGRPPAGPALARVPRGTLRSAVVFKQVLRSRACRALAQDDNAAPLRGNGW